MGRALKVGPQNMGLPIGFQSDRIDLAQVPHQSCPGHIEAVRLEPSLQAYFLSQGVGGIKKEADFGQGGVEGGKGVILTPAGT
jgi:hypothetical protein